MKRMVSLRKYSKSGFLLIALTVLSLLARADTAPLAKIDSVSLEGKSIPAANQIEENWVKTFSRSALLLFRCSVKPAQGTILLCPGGGYNALEMKKEGENTAHFLNQEGFDVALLEYHVGQGAQSRDLALADALAAFRLLKNKAPELGLHNGRCGIMGYSAGGHLAARTVQNLAENEQPEYLILVYPAFLQETISGTVIPAVRPPLKPGSLFVAISSNDNADWIKSSQEYAKTWKGFGGATAFHLLPEAGHGFGMGTNSASSAQRWPDLLKTFLLAKPETASTGNPASAPVAHDSDRHKAR